MAARITNNELVDMLLIYGESGQNSQLAARLYAENFPNRFHPAPPRFVTLVQRARDTGELQPQRGRDGGRPQPQRMVNVKQNILDLVRENPNISTREIGQQLNISHTVAWRTLNEDLQHPFHYQRVQALQAGDHEQRLHFSRWILEQNEINPQFTNEIFFTDETTFTRNGVFNFHNSHYWSTENPHVIRRANFQHRFSVNVWGGVVNGRFIGLHKLPARVNGMQYYNFLRHHLDDYLEDVPLGVRGRMLFMHDGAPINFHADVRDLLNNEYPNRWLGRGGPIPWPPRSPDFNPMDYYVWGFLKALVYPPNEPDLQNIDDLRQRITQASAVFRVQGEDGGGRGIRRATSESLVRRARLCIQCNGGNFEHLL